MDIAGLAFDPLLLAVADHEIRDEEEQEAGKGGDNRNAHHEREQVSGGIFPEVPHDFEAVADGHALELAQKVELDGGRVHDLAADVVARGVENAELRHGVRHEVGDNARNLREAEQSADGDRQNDGKTDGRPHADEHTHKDGPRDLQRVLATREHAVIVDAAQALVLGFLPSPRKNFFNTHTRAQR